ncbi:hypothetical protein BH11PSE9_BH11PSE9_32950 [soil metagenome]
MSVPVRVLVLAVDGLEGPVLRQLAAEGRLPATARLLAEGMSADLAYPPPHVAAAHWATVATGTTADRHGICHPLVSRIDGLIVEPATAADLHCAPFWKRAWQAGVPARVAGWPATLGTQLPAAAPPGSGCVADGFAHPEASAHHGWPLAPGAVAPASERAAARAARVHPQDVPADLLASFLEGLPGSLEAPARQLLAQWESVHRLGAQWASRGGSPVIALRFEGVHGWLSALAAQGIAAAQGLAPCYRRFDEMLGHCLEWLPADSHLMLLTETAPGGAYAPAFDTRVDQHTVTGLGDDGKDGDGNSAALRLAGLGAFAMRGPKVSPGRRALPVNALDILPTVLRLMGLGEAIEAIESVGAAKGSAALTAPASYDAIALAWLRQHGCDPGDFEGKAGVVAMRARAQAIRVEAIVGWAAARAAQGFYADAANALRRALLLTSDAVTRDGLRLLLAQASLNAAGFASPRVPSADPSAPWVLSPPSPQQATQAAPRPPAEARTTPPEDPVMADGLAALAAFADCDWPAAETRLRRLVDFAPRPIAAMAAGWFGRARLAQADAAQSDLFLAAALRQEAADAATWIAWRDARAAMGSSWMNKPAAADVADSLAMARAILPYHVLLFSSLGDSNEGSGGA